RSFSYEHDLLPHNERLEFLGDAVLQLAVTEHLYSAHPTLPEGDLARRRAATVSTRALAVIASTLDLGAYVRLGRGEDLTGGRAKSSILADTTEAVIGAVHLALGRTSPAASCWICCGRCWTPTSSSRPATTSSPASRRSPPRAAPPSPMR